MAIFMDSFQHYTSAQLVRKWSVFTTAGPVIISGNQYGGTMLTSDVGSAVSNLNMQKFLGASATWSVSLSLKFGEQNPSWSRQVLSFLSNATSQIQIAIDNDQKVKVYSGSPTHSATSSIAITGGTLLATVDSLLSPNVWYQLEIKATFATSVGANAFQVRLTGPGVDETATVTTGANTNPAATASADRIAIFGLGTGSATNRRGTSYSGIYADNGQAALLGNVRVAALYPNANGNSSQWVGSDGNSTDNYLLVDEATPNDDTDYVTTETDGHIDFYGMTNLPTPAESILGVQFNVQARKTDAADAYIEPAYRIPDPDEIDPPTNYFDSPIMVGNAYHNIHAGLTLSPDTSAAWTEAEVNTMEAGYRSSL
jgi:hypothetical protein